MCFDINSLFGIKPSYRISTLNGCVLAVRRWHCDARSFTIGHNCTTSDHGSNWIAIPEGCAKGLEEHANNAFTSGVPAGAVIKRIAPAVRGEEAWIR